MVYGRGSFRPCKQLISEKLKIYKPKLKVQLCNCSGGEQR
jgi:hypothetical protein